MIVLAAFVWMLALGVSEIWAGSNTALVGTWSGDFAGEPFQLILNADGTGQMDGPIQWQVQGNKLVIAEDDGSTEYKFVLKGSKLTISGGDMEAPLTLTRAGGSGKATAPSAQAPAGKASRGAAVQFLAGQYSAYSGHSTYSGSYSSEKRGALCSNGLFQLSSETSSSGSSGLAGVQGGNNGRWTAEGDELRGTLILQFSNGQQQRIPYAASMNPKDRSFYGPAVTFDGTTYQRTGDGNCR
ncbi:MAG: hypothetical protein EXR97_05405 [Nitrospiraceae bacterium]|nr:hypothetical protein [Nitrospiraceae bacterium]MSR25081.1 hypothetical protein [Nitrospiraceae bacterium]